MARLKIRAEAQADLKSIDRFSADRFGQAVADAYVRGLAKAFDQIADFPHSAPLREDFGPGIHSRTYRSHRILYVIDDQGEVEILAILHHSRDVPHALEP